MAACGTDVDDQPEASPTASVEPTPTPTPSPSASATPTQTPESTPRPPPPTATPEPVSSSPSRAASKLLSCNPGNTPLGESFDRDRALNIAGDIIEDIATVDLRLMDGIAVPSALGLLESSFSRLVDLGAPPKVDAAGYCARLKTLESFADQAADEYDSDRMNSEAKYYTVRKETGVLFAQLNAALGTSLRLP